MPVRFTHDNSDGIEWMGQQARLCAEVFTNDGSRTAASSPRRHTPSRSRPSPSLHPPPWNARFHPFPSVPDPVWQNTNQRVTAYTPMVQCLVTELTFHQRDLNYFDVYHARIAREMTEAQHEFLAAYCPRMGQGLYSTWDGVWRVRQDIVDSIGQTRSLLLETDIWHCPQALDAYLLITGQ